MKKLILSGIIVVAALINVGAATLSVDLPANTSTQLFQGQAVYINSITLQNTNAVTGAYVYFYSSPYFSYRKTNAATVSFSKTVYTTNQWYTNILGRVNSNTFLTWVTATNTVTGSSNGVYPLLYTTYVNSNNTTVTYTPVDPIYSAVGVATTNSARVTYTIDYDQF